MTDVRTEPPRPEPPSIVCPRCGRRSYHLRDIQERYCAACHRFHDDEDEEDED